MNGRRLAILGRSFSEVVVAFRCLRGIFNDKLPLFSLQLSRKAFVWKRNGNVFIRSFFYLLPKRVEFIFFRSRRALKSGAAFLHAHLDRKYFVLNIATVYGLLDVNYLFMGGLRYSQYLFSFKSSNCRIHDMYAKRLWISAMLGI
jgi:hypothetical protein